MSTLARLLTRLIASLRSPRPSAELLVIPAIILLLLTLVGPSLLMRRDQARKQQHQNHFRQLGQSLQSYHDTFQRFPSAATPGGQPIAKPAATQPARKKSKEPDLVSPL